MSLLPLLYAVAADAGVGVAVVDDTAKTIERGGLYAIIAILLVALTALFALKERQQSTTTQLLLALTEKQTAVLTEVLGTQKKIEAYLARHGD